MNKATINYVKTLTPKQVLKQCLEYNQLIESVRISERDYRKLMRDTLGEYMFYSVTDKFLDYEYYEEYLSQYDSEIK